jgi:hypothetical protein
MAISHKNYNPDLKYGAVADEGDLAITQGSILVGNSSGLGVELDASTTTQILVGNGTTITSVALSSDVTMTNAGVVTIANDAITEAKVADSAGVAALGIQKFAIAVYDFAVDGGTAGSIALANTSTIPDNAVVTAVDYDVITTCTSSSDAATIALALVTDGGLTTAIAISDASNPWDAGVYSAAGVSGAFSNDPTTVKTTGARDILLSVAGGQNLTAGKIVFRVEYWISQ